MANGIKPMLIGLMLVTLFAFALYSFVVGFIYQNNPTSDITNYAGVNRTITSLNSSVNGVISSSNSIKSTFERTNSPSLIYLFLIFEGAFYVPYMIFNVFLGGVYTIGEVFFINLLGIGGSQYAIVFGVIVSLIIISAVLAIIRAIRTGQEGGEM